MPSLEIGKSTMNDDSLKGGSAMQRFSLFRKILFLAVCTIIVSFTTRARQTKHWVTAYYGGWQLCNGSNGYLPVSQVDFTAMTHVIHFALVPKPDGTLDTVGNSITWAGSHALTKAAHAAGTKALVSLGGWNSESGFESATRPARLSTFVMNILSLMAERGYDGIDVDWEPLNPNDYDLFRNFVKTLREGLGPKYLLTTTAGQGYGAVMSSIQQYVDQINIMTYDLSFPSPGWVSWYNGPLHQHGVRFESTGGAVPACDNIVDTFLQSGVSREKIGIGIEFGGSVWKGGLTSSRNGVTGPIQSWSVAPSITPDVPYFTIMRSYYSPSRYHWDPDAKASYLSIDSTGSAGDCFITYDDSSDIAAKLEYVQRERLGGVILYELGMGYTGNGLNPFLDFVKRASAASTPRRTPSEAASQR